MKRLFFVLAMSLSMLLFVACGGGAEPEPSGPEPVTLDFSGYDEFRYDPSIASVEAGAEVTVNFTNEGALEHNWLLASDRVDPLEVTEADALSGATSGLIAGGETTTFTFSAPPAGTYQILCTVAGHAAGGMIGTFVVE